MPLWNPHSRVTLPAPSQGYGNWCVEGNLFVQHGCQNHQPPLLERRKRGRDHLRIPRGSGGSVRRTNPRESKSRLLRFTEGGLLSNLWDKELPGRMLLCLARGGQVLRLPSQCKYHSQPWASQESPEATRSQKEKQLELRQPSQETHLRSLNGY